MGVALSIGRISTVSNPEFIKALFIVAESRLLDLFVLDSVSTKEKFRTMFDFYEEERDKLLKENLTDYEMKLISIFGNSISRNIANSSIGDFYSQQMKICIRVKGAFKVINIKEIIFIEKINGLCMINLDGGIKIPCNESLKNFEKRLSFFGFFRSHQSFLIQMYKIIEIQLNSCQREYIAKLEGTDENILISKAKYPELKKLIKNYFIFIGK